MRQRSGKDACTCGGGEGVSVEAAGRVRRCTRPSTPAVLRGEGRLRDPGSGSDMNLAVS